MDRPRPPRRRPEAPSAPTTLHEITRRYVATALALSKAMGLPLTETFMREHRESISCCFIESGRAGVRLPAGVTLPPLDPVGHPAPEPEPDRAPLPAGAGEAPIASTNGQASPPLIIPAGFPSAGVRISDLKPGVLPMLIAKTAALVHAEGEAWVPLLGSLQRERAARLERGRRPRGEG